MRAPSIVKKRIDVPFKLKMTDLYIKSAYIVTNLLRSNCRILLYRVR